MFSVLGKGVGLMICLCCSLALSAQDKGYTVIQDIRLEGNKHTRDRIILRELTFSIGDTISLDQLPKVLKESEEWVLNTGLFNEGKVFLEGPAEHGQVVVSVKEALYIFPTPVFELVDRNIKVWWIQHNRSFQRMRIGGDFVHTNLTGNGDRFKVQAKFGYSHQYTLEYTTPYLDKQQRIRLSLAGDFAKYREINYSNSGNIQFFHRNEERFVFFRWNALAALTYRPKNHTWHTFGLEYRNNRIDPSVASDLNPDFFLDGRIRQRYLSLFYRFEYQKVDVRPYPWSGFFFHAFVRKDGLGLHTDRNNLFLQPDLGIYVPLGKRFNTVFEAGGKFSLIRQRQPFNDYRALGFGKAYLYGYDLYVVDGLDMLYFRNRLRMRLVDFRVNFGKVMPIKSLRSMPVRLVGSLNSSVGFVHDPFNADFNTFGNQILYGLGVGLDIIFFYDKVLRFEYSYNHLFENGLFLRLDFNI